MVPIIPKINALEKKLGMISPTTVSEEDEDLLQLQAHLKKIAAGKL